MTGNKGAARVQQIHTVYERVDASDTNSSCLLHAMVANGDVYISHGTKDWMEISWILCA